MINILVKLGAFIKRDFLSQISYRLAFLLQVIGIFFSLLAVFFMAKMVDAGTEGLRGARPFDYWLIGFSFQFYFSAALYGFSAKIRNEQVLGTLEALLVSPTPTGLVIFSSAAWDFTYGAIRILLYMGIGMLFFGTVLHWNSLPALLLGVLLTLLSSAGLGILSASFILYFKRGDPINFLLSGLTTFFGTVFFPVEQLPEWARGASNFVPLKWSLEIVRGALLHGDSFSELSEALVWLAGMTLVLLPSGLFASRIAIRRAKRAGSLIQY